MKMWVFLRPDGSLLGARPNSLNKCCLEDRTFSFDFNVHSKQDFGLALKQLLGTFILFNDYFLN